MSASQADARPRVTTVTIDESHAGQRIDNFLGARLKGVPKSRLYRVLRKGEVRVNRRRIGPDYRLQAGDQVRIPPLRMAEQAPPPRPAAGVLARLAEAVLYEDAGLLVLDKPAGMAVHGGSGLDYGLIEALRLLRPQEAFLELVHRLDRETSGCLMVAKSRGVLQSLHARLREGEMDKRYLALVRGRWAGGERTVAQGLHKNVLSSGERLVRASAGGKASVTRFRPLRRFREATLVEARPETGRTHQIRVHAAELGHPIAGDGKYGDAAFNRRLRGLGLRRLFLHAAGLRIGAGADLRALTVEAPLPAELESVLRALA